MLQRILEQLKQPKNYLILALLLAFGVQSVAMNSLDKADTMLKSAHDKMFVMTIYCLADLRALRFPKSSKKTCQP